VRAAPLHAVVVAVDLAELLLRSEAASEAVKLAGAAVLFVLGGTYFMVGAANPPSPQNPRRRGTPLLRGLLTNLTKPKATLFFVAVSSQFVSANQPGKAVPVALGLATIAVLFSFTGLGADRGTHRLRPTAGCGRAPGAGWLW
jgi:threonine/homoserine/homoserine lactone efflux protein